MAKRQKQPTFAEILDEAKRINGAKDAYDHGTKAVAVLLASAFIGPDVEKLQKFTGYDRTLIELFEGNCRKNGIWVGDKVHGSWFDEENGGMELVLDGAVAAGLLERSKGGGGKRHSRKIGAPA